jgi:Asp-tRNA(Asn)/Glu-tRNA(Gln) amidotransferase A subunit family amidase
MKMTIQYDRTHVKTPRLRGFALRMVLILLERRWIATLLAPLLTRGLGIKEFRATQAHEPLTFLAIHRCEVCDAAPKQTLNDVPRLKHVGSGFQFHRVRDFQRVYERGIVTPDQIAERVLQAIESSDALAHPLNAFISYDHDDVRRQAREATQRYREGRIRGPLDGVPIAIKDEVDMVPYRTTGGTRFLGKKPAQTDSTAVARLREAGALLIGKANMHEIGILPDGLNPHYGRARNPYNPGHDTGGSSSGSAAAVAAGLCPVALGADGGGSIRIPASFCGVIGLKPTYGRISEHGALPLCGSVAHLGPLAATAEDAAFLYRAIAGIDPHDSNTAPQPPVHFATDSGDLKGVRIGVYSQWFSDAASDVVAPCERVLQDFVQMGAQIVEIAIPDLMLFRVAHGLTIHAEMAANMQTYDAHRSEFGLTTRLMLANVRAMTPADYIRAQQFRTRAIAQFASALTSADVIVTPTTPRTAPGISERDLPQGAGDVGQTIEVMRFAYPANLTGHPAISFPVAYDRFGLPIGMQFIGRPWDEALLFRLAYAADSFVERAKPRIHFDLLPELSRS